MSGCRPLRSHRDSTGSCPRKDCPVWGCASPGKDGGARSQPVAPLCPVQRKTQWWPLPRSSAPVFGGPGLSGPLEETRPPLLLCGFPSCNSKSDHLPLRLWLPCLWFLPFPPGPCAGFITHSLVQPLFPSIMSFKWQPGLSSPPEGVITIAALKISLSSFKPF